MSAESAEQLRKIYARRFEPTQAYRARVWRVLISSFFNRWLRPDDQVLDLGCGYGEFINQISCSKRYAMDLNPTTARYLASDVVLLQQDCSAFWELPDSSLDVVFTSNFFEHLPSKASLSDTLRQVWRCLKPGGRLIAMGPNIRFLAHNYWDFFDHHIALSERSLAEAMATEGFTMESTVSRFLPYTLVNAPRYPLWVLKIYLAIPLFWMLFGRQFLVIGIKDLSRA